MSKKSDSWFNLIQTVSNVESSLGLLLQDRHGIGLSEYRALEVLARSPNSELRMQELASYLRLNQSSVSRLVERLERDGLTIRDLCQRDKRGVYTVITKEGHARLKRAQPDYEHALDSGLKEHGGEKFLSLRTVG